MPVSRRTRVEHDKPISRVQNIIKEVGIGPKGVFIAANLRLIGGILDREWGYFQKFVSPEVVPYTDGIALSSTDLRTCSLLYSLLKIYHRSILLL